MPKRNEIALIGAIGIGLFALSKATSGDDSGFFGGGGSGSGGGGGFFDFGPGTGFGDSGGGATGSISDPSNTGNNATPNPTPGDNPNPGNNPPPATTPITPAPAPPTTPDVINHPIVDDIQPAPSPAPPPPPPPGVINHPAIDDIQPYPAPRAAPRPASVVQQIIANRQRQTPTQRAQRRISKETYDMGFNPNPNYGKSIRERKRLGSLTSPHAYREDAEPVRDIDVIKRRIADQTREAGFNPNPNYGKSIRERQRLGSLTSPHAQVVGTQEMKPFPAVPTRQISPDYDDEDIGLISGQAGGTRDDVSETVGNTTPKPKKSWYERVYGHRKKTSPSRTRIVQQRVAEETRQAGFNPSGNYGKSTQERKRAGSLTSPHAYREDTPTRKRPAPRYGRKGGTRDSERDQTTPRTNKQVPTRRTVVNNRITRQTRNRRIRELPKGPPR